MSFNWSRKKPISAVLTASLLLLQASSALAAPAELSLADSIALALKNNPSMKMAYADKDKAAWSVNEAKAGRQPSLALGSSYNIRQSAENPVLNNDSSDLSTSLRLSLPLYSGGRIESQIDRAGLDLKIADLSVLKARQQVRLDTATAYYTVLQAQNMNTVNQETVQSLKEHLKTVEAKYQAGVVAKSDVLRSEVELANAEQNMVKSQNNYDVAVASLKNVIVMDPEAEVVLKDTLAYQKFADTLAQDIDLALKNRPDIAQAKAAVESAGYGVKIAESGKLPSVSLGGSTQWGDSLLPDSDNNWSLNLTASWDVFDSGLTHAQIKQAGSSLAKTKEQLQQTRDNVQLEVRQTYLNVREAEKRLETTSVAIAKAEEDLFIAQEKYRAGAGTNLDVIDARLALTQAKTNHVQALYDYNVNKAKLDKAIGSQAE